MGVVEGMWRGLGLRVGVLAEGQGGLVGQGVTREEGRQTSKGGMLSSWWQQQREQQSVLQQEEQWGDAIGEEQQRGEKKLVQQGKD